MASAEGQQHPLGIYYKIWSALRTQRFSYASTTLKFKVRCGGGW